jgi:phenylacetate-CoA ligase
MSPGLIAAKRLRRNWIETARRCAGDAGMTTREAEIDALRQIRERRLRRTLDLCASAHPFYRRRFQDLGLAVGDIETLDDLARLPLTHKADYMAAPEDFRLRADDIDGAKPEERTLWNVAYTTGTTSGKPSPFFNTTHDQYTIMMQARRCAELEGFVPGDTIANLVPLPPMPTGAFLVVGRTAEIMGLRIVNALTGAKNPDFPIHRGLDEAIDCVAAASPSVFWGVPSFVRRFLRRARERGVGFPEARMVVVSGEPVSAALKAEYIEHLTAFGATSPQIRVRYSCTEMQGGLVQCCNAAAAQNAVPDLYHLEVVDPDTGAPVPPGEEGALALTHLHRRGTVFLRYLVGDLVGLRLEAVERHVRPPEVARHVIDDVARGAVGRDPYVTHVEQQPLAPEHRLVLQPGGLELGREALRRDEPHARRAPVAEQLLARLANSGGVEILAGVDVAADRLVPAPAVLLVRRAALQQHLAARVHQQEVDRTHRQARALRLVARPCTDHTPGRVVDVYRLGVGLRHAASS